MRNKTVRIPDTTLTALDNYCKSRRINESTLIRLALEEKLTRDDGFEERIGQSLAYVSRELNQLMATLDTFIFAFFRCVPEPADVKTNMELAKERKQKFMEAAGRAYMQTRQANGKGVVNNEAMV